MKYHGLFFPQIGKDAAKIVVCYSRDWRFKGGLTNSQTASGSALFV